jgi:GT2 family glycosyltransferase
MQQGGSPLNTHSELIRSLRKQLEATERELANQKWVFEQFLQSPSWKITRPLRWIAGRARAARQFLGGTPAPSTNGNYRPAEAVITSPLSERSPLQLKDVFAEHYAIQLRNVLASDVKLALPHADFPQISIVLVLFNRAELTLACLRSIREHASEPLEVIIVDNASSDDTPRLLDRVEGARIIRNPENLHFLRAVNHAAREARGKHLLLLNNDAQLLPGALAAAVSTLESSSDIGAVGGRIILLDGVLQEAGSIVWRDGSCVGYGRGDDPFLPMYMFRRDVDYCSGAFLLTPRPVWQRLNGFDETFAPAYYEETDYCVRLWEQGLRVVYEPNAAILHYEFASSQTPANAIGLQREHQAVFAGRHTRFLAAQSKSDPDAAPVARMRNAEKRILVLDDRPPHSWLGSGFPRAQTILRALLKQGYFATFYPTDDMVQEDWASIYSDLPATVEFMTGMGRPLLEAFLRNRRGYYDTILVSRPHNMNLLKPILASNPAWFDNVRIIYDAEALFATREIARQELAGKPLDSEHARRLVDDEVQLAAGADCVVSVSEHEAAAFRKSGAPRVQVLGHTLRANPTTKAFSERTGFLFAGAIHDEASPNGDAVIWFLTEIFPKIRAAIGDATPFTIAGVNDSDTIVRLAESCSARVLGFVRDLTELYESARVFVAPGRYAAGLPHKVHESAARGLPVVATPLLAAQLGWQDGSHLAIGRTSDEFAQKCVQLHTNEACWTAMRHAALERIREECSYEVFENQLKEVLRSTVGAVYDRASFSESRKTARS